VRSIRITFEIDGVVGRESFAVPACRGDHNIVISMAEASMLLGQCVLSATLTYWSEDCVGLMDRFRILRLEGMGAKPESEAP
jgi:hypothetical protein